MTHRVLKTTALALGLALASFAVAFAEPDPKPKPDDPKPKADIAMTAGQAETAANTQRGQAAANGGGPHLNSRAALAAPDSKFLQKVAPQKRKASPTEILPYVEHK